MTQADIPPRGTWAEAKLDRATGHFEDLKSRVDAWFAADPYQVEPVIADNRLGWQLYLRVNHHPPLIEWAVILGDCFHNLRSALDAAVWELSNEGGATPKNPKLVQFPFSGSSADWQRRVDGSLAGLPIDLLHRLEAVQPYNHSQGGEKVSALALLNQLDIDDKHKAGITAEVRATEASIRTEIGFDTDDTPARRMRPIQEITLELGDRVILRDEVSLYPITDVRGDLDATIAFSVITRSGHAELWSLLHTTFSTVIFTLDHLYGLADNSTPPRA